MRKRLCVGLLICSLMFISALGKRQEFQSDEFGSKCRNPWLIPMKAETAQFIVHLHNRYRSRVTTGKERAGNPGPQPRAANMRALVWDDGLAAAAESWAKQCHFEVDRNRKIRKFGTGQNLAIRYATEPLTANWADVVESFYRQVKYANAMEISHLRLEMVPVIGLYTQLVSARTAAVGCAAVAFQPPRDIYTYAIFYVCNYGPAGNLLYNPVYDIGQPCSACPVGTRCSNIKDEEGLCVRV